MSKSLQRRCGEAEDDQASAGGSAGKLGGMRCPTRNHIFVESALAMRDCCSLRPARGCQASMCPEPAEDGLPGRHTQTLTSKGDATSSASEGAVMHSACKGLSDAAHRHATMRMLCLPCRLRPGVRGHGHRSVLPSRRTLLRFLLAQHARQRTHRRMHQARPLFFPRRHPGTRSSFRIRIGPCSGTASGQIR